LEDKCKVFSFMNMGDK